MIYFSDASGTLTRCVPAQVYQGSAEGNRLFLVAPFAQNAEVYAAFRLPDGTSTERYRLDCAGAIGGISGQGGAGVYGWQCALPACVTEQYGSVTVQFFRIVAGEELSVFAAQFTVERGVRPQLPAAPGEDVYRAIAEALAAIGADLRNGFFAARAIYAWNAAFTYGANEVAFYPVGEHGAFVRSLHADNAEPPYAEDGTLNGEHWAETVNFDTVSEEYFGALRAEVDRAEDAADRAQAFAQQLASVLDREVLLVDVLPQSPQADALYLLLGEGDSLFELWMYDGEWVSFGGADIVLNTTTFYSGTLAAGGWAGGRQILALAEVAAEDAVYAVPADGYAAAYLAAGVRAAEVTEGGIIFSCKSAPSQDIAVALAVTRRQDAPLSARESYYTKAETDGLLSAESSARSQADAALGGRIDEILAGGTPVAQASNAAHAASADSATSAANAAHAVSADSASSAAYAESAGSAASAVKAAQDAGGNDIAATYATKAEVAGAGNFDAAGTYPDLTAGEASHAASADSAANAANATYAASAGSAANDGAGNNIAATYAKGADVQSALAQLQEGSTVVGRATADAAGNNIAATYATKSELAASGGGSGGGMLYRHDLFITVDENSMFTSTIINRSATPFSTAQALLDYVKSEGWQISPQIRPLLASGDTFNGDGLMYGIGEHTTYPDALGILYRSSSGKMTQNALYISKMAVTDHVTEI